MALQHCMFVEQTVNMNISRHGISFLDQNVWHILFQFMAGIEYTNACLIMQQSHFIFDKGFNVCNKGVRIIEDLCSCQPKEHRNHPKQWYMCISGMASAGLNWQCSFASHYRWCPDLASSDSVGDVLASTTSSRTVVVANIRSPQPTSPGEK